MLYLLDESCFSSQPWVAGSQPSLAARHAAPTHPFVCQVSRHSGDMRLCTSLASIDSPEFSVVYFTPSARVHFPFKPRIPKCTCLLLYIAAFSLSRPS